MYDCRIFKRKQGNRPNKRGKTMKDLKTLIAEYNAKHNADVTHVLKGEDFLTLYAVTDAVVFVEVHQEGFETQNLVISLNVFEKS